MCEIVLTIPNLVNLKVNTDATCAYITAFQCCPLFQVTLRATFQ